MAAPINSSAAPTIHSRVRGAPVNASGKVGGGAFGGVLGGGVLGGGVVAAVAVVTAAMVTGAAVTGVVTVLVGHVVVAVPATGGPQPGPLHEAVLVTTPVASVALAVTRYVSV